MAKFVHVHVHARARHILVNEMHYVCDWIGGGIVVVEGGME